jgi:hypothetical protein
MHYFKLLGKPEGFRDLWECREALDKYLARLKELMEEDETQQQASAKPSSPENTEIMEEGF